MDIRECMIKLGWCKYDGNIWIKEKESLTLSFDNAVIWELRQLIYLKEKVKEGEI